MIMRLVLSLAVVLYLVSPLRSDDAEAVKTSEKTAPKVVYLHTEWKPVFNEPPAIRKKKGDPARMQRLGRELVRQAMMVTISHELGIPVRDATLHEAVPENAELVHLAALVRHGNHRKWKVKLYRLSPNEDGEFPDEIPRELWTETPDWEQIFKCASKRHKVYESGSAVFEKASRNNFVDALKAVGLELDDKKRSKRQVDVDQIADWSERLLEVDFVAQYSVLREVHQAIASHGESTELLGLLTRGYANLGLMTTHSWNSSTEVFAARSMIYANRMMNLDQESDIALQHKAWAFSLIGIQQTAISALEKIGKRRNEAAQADAKATTDSDKPDEPSELAEIDDPQWTDLLDPYLQWDREAMLDIADFDKALRPWALRLYFQMVDDYRYEHEVLQAYEDVAAEIPSAWGIYAGLNRYRSLRTIRVAAPESMAAWAAKLPRSVRKLAGLPGEVRQKAKANGGMQFLLPKNFRRSDSAMRPHQITRALRRADAKDMAISLPWSSLAFLIDDEQFLQVARFMRMSLNATESNYSQTVDRLVPLVKGHRYEPYIEGFRFYNRGGDNVAKYKATLSKIKRLPDARKNMYWLVKLISDYGVPDLEEITMNYDSTGRAVMENVLQWNNLKGGNLIESSSRKWYAARAKDLRSFFPHSVVGIRIAVQTADQPELKQLKKWEQQLKSDSIGLALLGRHYQTMGDTDEAIRILKASLDGHRVFLVTKQLANLHYDQDDYEAWESTWLDLMRSEGRGMTSSAAAGEVAWGYTARGMWRDAKPYAETAAEVWSSHGLGIASDVTEQLGLWDESEHWVKSQSTSYPSYRGASWYFWCRRTGRGDLNAARQLAEKHFGATGTDRSRTACVNRGVYFLMEGDAKRSLAAYEKALQFYTSLSCSCMVIRLARETGDDERAKEVITLYREYVAGLESQDPIDLMGLELMNLIESEKLDRVALKKLDSRFAEIAPVNASMTSFMVGQELLARGHEEISRKYFRQSMLSSQRESAYMTIAGHELSQLDGTSRPDDDELTPADLWQPVKEAANASEDQ